MAAAATRAAGVEAWERIPGWTPVYVGLGRFRTGLILRLVVIVIAMLALGLAKAHGPPLFLDVTVLLAPLAAAATSLLMVSGLRDYARPPRQTKASGGAQRARLAFTGLLFADVLAVGLALGVVLELGGLDSLYLLSVLQVGRWLIGVVAIACFLISIREIAAFLGASPMLIKLKNLWRVTLGLALGLIAAAALYPLLLEVGAGVTMLASLLVLSAAVFVMAGTGQVVANLREDLFLTTSEFAVVSVTGERTAVPDPSETPFVDATE